MSLAESEKSMMLNNYVQKGVISEMQGTWACFSYLHYLKDKTIKIYLFELMFLMRALWNICRVKVMDWIKNVEVRKCTGAKVSAGVK